MRLWRTGLLVAVAAATLAAAGEEPPSTASQSTAAAAPAQKRPRVCRWLRRVAAVEPALAEKLSSWGIPKADRPQPAPANRVSSRQEAPFRERRGTLATLRWRGWRQPCMD